MDECKHGMHYRCSFCNGTDTVLDITVKPPPKPKKARKVKKARVDPDMVIADRVARGEICEHCLTETAPIGCECSRRRFYTDQAGPNGLVPMWLEEHHSDFMPMGTADAARALRTADMVVSGLGFSTQNRASRRAGLSRDNGKVTPSEVQADRLLLLKRFGIEPRYFKARTQEGSHLPV